MSMIFTKEYSDAYDDFYKEKDYVGECKLIEHVIKNYSRIKVKSILDLGCGTGSHAIQLASDGYDVTGVDRSSEMLNVAISKSIHRDTTCDFLQSDIRHFNDTLKYDAVIMMFAVLGYQYSNEDVIAALKTVSRHLKKGGVFICDLWYGPTVIKQSPADKIRVIEKDDSQIIRKSSGVIDTSMHLVNVHFHLWNIKGGIIVETEEDHAMRFFFPQELKLLFENAGLKILRIGQFPNVEKDPVDTSWSVCVVAKCL